MTKPAEWILASHNAGKLREIQALFGNLPIELRNAGELGLPVPEETGSTFEANAELKAVAAAKATGMISLSDDSGVSVDALGGDPGINTALWAGPERDFAIARQRVQDGLKKLGADASRRATYVCVFCVAWPDGRTRCFRGETRGSLVWPVRGILGFGFEPMFLPDGYAITYGEMQPEQRARVNARAQAMRRLREALFSPRANADT